VRRSQRRDLLVVAGGPHENNVGEKMAWRLAGIDVSVGGSAEHVLGAVLKAQESWPSGRPKGAFLNGLPEALSKQSFAFGRGRVSSRAWGRGGGVELRFWSCHGGLFASSPVDGAIFTLLCV